MANLAGSSLMTWDEKKERATDLIAFLSIWGISRLDAQNILSIAYNEIKEMNSERFIKVGRDMDAFNKMGSKANDG